MGTRPAAGGRRETPGERETTAWGKPPDPEDPYIKSTPSILSHKFHNFIYTYKYNIHHTYIYIYLNVYVCIY